MVDRPRAQRLLEVLLDALGDLRRYAQRVDAVALREDRDVQNMVLHALYIAVQSSIDLAFHIAASEGLPAPGSYQQAFIHLGKAGILDAEHVRRMAGGPACATCWPMPIPHSTPSASTGRSPTSARI
jgi:uncharacterized protein YutE (UPF0331/DUF86 family)